MAFKKKCFICQNGFETSNLKRNFCGRVACRIRVNFAQLAKKGYDPVLYYNNLMKQGEEVTCSICENKYPPTYTKNP